MVDLTLKEVINVRLAKNIIAKVAKNVAEATLKRDANQTTCSFIFQPKVPNALKRFKKESV